MKTHHRSGKSRLTVNRNAQRTTGSNDDIEINGRTHNLTVERNESRRRVADAHDRMGHSGEGIRDTNRLRQKDRSDCLAANRLRFALAEYPTMVGVQRQQRLW